MVKQEILPGIYNINKPKTWTSFDVVNKIRRISGIKKVGHAGTLDPMATGVLVIAVGREYTREIESIVTTKKTYQAEIMFGIKTDSYDLDGKVTYMSKPAGLTKQDVLQKLEKFRGEIMQKPPIFSAKKVNGKRLYKYARKNQEVEIKPRQVTIISAELDSYTDDDYPVASFVFEVSKGTYIRSIAYDMGEMLGVGAVLSGLKRLQVGEYKITESHELEEYY